MRLPGGWRMLVALLATVQLFGATLLATRGFPYFGSSRVSNARTWELPVAAFHLPGIVALRATGFCCGLRNGIVLGPKVAAGHIAMSPRGLVVLTLTNWGAWLVMGGMVWAGARRWGRRRAARPAGPPVGPPGR